MPSAEIEPQRDTRPAQRDNHAHEHKPDKQGKPDKPDKQPSQDELVADIERTRENLARTIDAISDRLSPANAARRAADRARERVTSINPAVAGGVVLAVTGVTVAWILLRRRKARKR
jgi:hypothetical protein